MKERALLLGEHDTMLGILSEPDVVPARELPIFIVLNAGIAHRIGPHRKSVKLTRALCEAGFRTLRFDLSGLGDSPARRDALSFSEAAIADIGEVLDDLQTKYDARRFVLMGLCSGADNAFYAAVRDPRVTGAVIMDGIAYRTPRYYAHHYGPRVRKRSAWINLGKLIARRLQQRLDGASGDNAPGPAAAPVAQYIREFEPREVVARKLQGLVDRGVRTYWVYTAGMIPYYNYREQFHDMFKSVDFKGVVDHEYFPDSNHTFTELRSQRMLIEAVVRWALRTFLAG